MTNQNWGRTQPANRYGDILQTLRKPGSLPITFTAAVPPEADHMGFAPQRGHATVKHSKKEWTRDDDGDGIREVHSNTIEGTWTGLRNFLRPFRFFVGWGCVVGVCCLLGFWGGGGIKRILPHTSPFSSGRTISSELPPHSSER